MPASLSEFFTLICSRMPLLLICTLGFAMLIVNGWTDAPNAIAGVVGAKVLSFRNAVIIACVFNFLGVLCVTSVSGAIAKSMFSIVAFSSARTTLIALCCAMLAVILWALFALLLCLPTSESHGLVAAMTGSAVALEGGFHCVHFGVWAKVLLGLLLCVFLGYRLGMQCAIRCKTWDISFFLARKMQILCACIASFLHGAQDGQKFIGMLLLALTLGQGRALSVPFSVPLWLTVCAAVFMALGTAFGGRRIIEKITQSIPNLSPVDGLGAELGSCISLFFLTVFALPVSTTHVRTCALIGAGSVQKKQLSRRTLWQMTLGWILTFPVCFFLSFLLSTWFSRLFPIL